MNTLLLSCAKASELVEKKSFVNLNWSENIQLHIHTRICSACALYQKQSLAIDNILYNHMSPIDDSLIPTIINKELKEKIISKL